MYRKKNKLGYSLFFIILIVMIGSCEKDCDECNKPNTIPIMITDTISSITETSAVSGGYIIDGGGEHILYMGVCWSTSPNPTLSDCTTVDSYLRTRDDSYENYPEDTCDYISNITRLTDNTIYYVRAYAINILGTAYGRQKSFTTTALTCPNDVSDVDGNIYNVVKIGGQCWMKENLKSTHYFDGSAISEIYAYNDNESNVATYGRLYTWAAVMSGTASSSANPSEVQGVCMSGWHVPSDEEWIELIDYLGGFRLANDKMRETSSLYWNSPNEGATNESDFTALPSGYRNTNGSFYGLRSYAYFWSATENNSSDALFFFLETHHYYASTVGHDKSNALSVRCIKD